MMDESEVPTKFCIFCGARIPSIAQYCEVCGRKLAIIEKPSILVEEREVERPKLRKTSVLFRHSFSIVLLIILVAYVIFSGYIFQGILSQRNSLSSELERYELRNPTIDELRDFLMKDQTSNNVASTEYYCTKFARDLRNNANIYGINMCIVLLDFRAHVHVGYDELGSFDFYGGHAMNGVVLNNGTFVWIEPQDDSIIHDRQTLEHHVEMLVRRLTNDISPSYFVNWLTVTDEIQIW